MTCLLCFNKQVIFLLYTCHKDMLESKHRKCHQQEVAMKHSKILLITALLLLNGSIVLSCAAPSESADNHTAVGEPTPTTIVTAAEDTAPAAATTAAEVTHAETTVAETASVNPAEIEFSCYAQIDTVNESHRNFIVTMTEDAFYYKGARLDLNITDDTILMQEDGTTLTYQDFQVGDPIGVVIEGIIQETDPAVPGCVTMIVKLHS